MRLRQCVALLLSVALLALQRAPASPFCLGGDVGLASLMALSDGHLQKLEQTLEIVAGREAARSAEWSQIRPALTALRSLNAPAVLWFALPDGTYWTLDGGLQKNRLADRAYWPKLLAKRNVLGDLVVSKSSRRTTAIVAVPILNGSRLTGMLGASVYLDKFSAQLKREMRLPAGTIFYSFDANALVAINWDPKLIFLRPRSISPALDRAFGNMLAHEEGRETYVFRNQSRTVLYRKSAVTGWWYAFGIVARSSSAAMAPRASATR
jgi:methyl-accepting chemotaxis protein